MAAADMVCCDEPAGIPGGYEQPLAPYGTHDCPVGPRLLSRRNGLVVKPPGVDTQECDD